MRPNTTMIIIIDKIVSDLDNGDSVIGIFKKKLQTIGITGLAYG